MTDTLVVAVISDMHVYTGHIPDGDTVSWLSPSTEKTIEASPLHALKCLITEKALRADALLFAGDLSHQADPDAAEFAWTALHEVAALLGDAPLIATAGNHDVDSRYKYNDHDAKGRLQQLAPQFPVPALELADKYWSRHFIDVPIPAGRVVVINSSAYHGYNDEYAHGRLSDRTLSQLKDYLAHSTPAEVNIVLCHHHLVTFGNVDTADSSTMSNGSRLADELAEHGRWLVVHGHKHLPNLMYAAGGANAPTILSAASLSAKPYPGQSGHFQNQFYLIEFPLATTRSLMIPWAGRFRTWNWTVNMNGFVPAKPDDAIPATGGFGLRVEPVALAEEIMALVGAASTQRWSEILRAIPKLEYLTPVDVKATVKTLRDKGCTVDEPGGLVWEVTTP